MKIAYYKILVKHEQPERCGYYDTDRGRLFWFAKEKEWSCRYDKISEEYPSYWLKEAAASILSPDNTARTAESDSIWLTELGIGLKERELILKRFAQDSKEVTDEEIEEIAIDAITKGGKFELTERDKLKAQLVVLGAKLMRYKLTNKTK